MRYELKGDILKEEGPSGRFLFKLTECPGLGRDANMFRAMVPRAMNREATETKIERERAEAQLWAAKVQRLEAEVDSLRRTIDDLSNVVASR